MTHHHARENTAQIMMNSNTSEVEMPDIVLTLEMFDTSMRLPITHIPIGVVTILFFA